MNHNYRTLVKAQLERADPAPMSPSPSKIIGGFLIGIALAAIILVAIPPILVHQIEIKSEIEKVPTGYYFTNKFPNYGGSSSDLEDFLTSGFEMPREYEVGTFDCSESAAYAEWALEDAGFRTYIVESSYCPWGSGGHAWVIVYTTDGYRVAVEPTALTGYGLWDRIKHFFTGRVKGVVYEGDQYEWFYYHPQHEFQDIYAAINGTGSTSEWNWWEGYWGFV